MEYRPEIGIRTPSQAATHLRYGNPAGNFNGEDAVWFELKRSPCCSLHDVRIIHGAGPNNSPMRRTGYTMRYFAPDRKFNDQLEENRGF